MSAQDSLWLTMDRPNNLMVIDGVMVLGEPLTIDQAKGVLTATGDRFPVFRRRAERQGQSWVWVDDPDFDLDHHLHEVWLGGHATMRDLQEFVAEQRSTPLSRERPLWQAFLVTGLHLDDGRVGCAMVSRMHHAVADGVRITQVMFSMCEQADDSVVPVVARTGTGDGPLNPVTAVLGASMEVTRVAFATASTAVSAMAGAVNSSTAALGTLVRPWKVPGAVAGLVRRTVDDVGEGVDAVRHPDRLLDALELLGADEHRATNDLATVAKLMLTDSGHATWTGTPGRSKVVVWSQQLPLEQVKQIGRRNAVTVNDVLLAAVAGGLQRYLALHGQEVQEVVWMVPVNLKPFADNLPEELGNYFALVMLPMRLHHDSHGQRLREVHHRMQRIKHSDEPALTFGIQTAVSVTPSTVATFVTNFFANKAVGVLTNVPGPTRQMTFAGAPVEQVIGFAPCSGDQPMTATIFSYDGGVTVGFAADAELIPDADTLADLVVGAVHEMVG